MQSVSDYAKNAGVSSRSVRARLERGSLRGEKFAGRWMVLDSPRNHRSLSGRKISMSSFNQLAAYIDDHTVAITPAARRRAKERAQVLAHTGLKALERYQERSGMKVHYFRADPSNLEKLRHESALQMTGVSHDISEVYSSFIDAYVKTWDLETMVYKYRLEPRLSVREANVLLREVEELPHIYSLHIALDLLDLRDARSRSEAERLLGKVLYEAYH